MFESNSGGSLVFGADGSLMISTGDGTCYTFIDGGGGNTYWSQGITDSIITSQQNVGSFRSQQLDCLNGKILRINPMKGDGIESNPYYAGSARTRVWTLGLRNPFRITLKPGTGNTDIVPESGIRYCHI